MISDRGGRRRFYKDRNGRRELPPYVSREFFHFMGRKTLHDKEATYQTLLTILEQGCISHPPHDNSWGTVGYQIDRNKSLLSEELIVPMITCYCDIPLMSLGVHMGKYGRFALSFCRDFVIAYGARPVIYIPHNPADWLHAHGGKHVLGEIEAKYRGLCRHVYPKVNEDEVGSNQVAREPKNFSSAVAHLMSTLELHVLAFVKPFDSSLPEAHPENYYMEREWRKYGNLKFTPRDVVNVIVDERFLDRFIRDQPGYADKVISAAEVP